MLVLVLNFFFFFFFFRVCSTSLFMCDKSGAADEAVSAHRWWRTVGANSMSLTSESETSSFSSRQLRVAAALPFIRVKPLILPQLLLRTKNQTGERQPAKPLSLNCHQFILCSYLSVTLPQLWKKNFHPFSRPHLCSSAFPHPAITER